MLKKYANLSEELNRIKYLMIHSEGSTITESTLLLEGQNEDQTEKILSKVNKENELDNILELDSTDRNKYAPIIAQFYVEGASLDALKYIFERVPTLENKLKIVPQRTKRGVIFNKPNDKFGIKANTPLNFIAFSEIIDKVYEEFDSDVDEKLKKNIKITTDDGSDANLVFNKNGIKIYEAHSSRACIQYSKGESFCIGNPSGGMYMSYRQLNDSTFHFVFDDNLPHPLGVVVVDKQKEERFSLTDQNNSTGRIHNPFNATDKNDTLTPPFDKYFEYLKTQGVDMNIFKNNPYTEEEKILNDLTLANYEDLDEFKDKIVGKTMKLPNGDVVDLTLEWLVRHATQLEKNHWDVIKNDNGLKNRIDDYEWRLSTSGAYLKNSVVLTFAPKYINRFVKDQIEQGHDIDIELLRRVKDKSILKTYVLMYGKQGRSLRGELLREFADFNTIKEYLMLYAKSGSASIGQVDDLVLNMLDEKSRQEFLNLYAKNKKDGGHNSFWEYLTHLAKKGKLPRDIYFEFLSEDQQDELIRIYIQSDKRSDNSFGAGDMATYAIRVAKNDKFLSDFIFMKLDRKTQSIVAHHIAKFLGASSPDEYVEKMIQKERNDLGGHNQILAGVSEKMLEKYVDYLTKNDYRTPDLLMLYIPKKSIVRVLQPFLKEEGFKNIEEMIHAHIKESGVLTNEWKLMFKVMDDPSKGILWAGKYNRFVAPSVLKQFPDNIVKEYNRLIKNNRGT